MPRGIPKNRTVSATAIAGQPTRTIRKRRWTRRATAAIQQPQTLKARMIEQLTADQLTIAQAKSFAKSLGQELTIKMTDRSGAEYAPERALGAGRN